MQSECRNDTPDIDKPGRLDVERFIFEQWSEEPARLAPLLTSFERWISRELARLPADKLVCIYGEEDAGESG